MLCAILVDGGGALFMTMTFLIGRIITRKNKVGVERKREYRQHGLGAR